MGILRTDPSSPNANGFANPQTSMMNILLHPNSHYYNVLLINVISCNTTYNQGVLLQSMYVRQVNGTYICFKNLCGDDKGLDTARRVRAIYQVPFIKPQGILRSHTKGGTNKRRDVVDQRK